MGIQGNVSIMLLDSHVEHSHYQRLKRIEEQIENGADLTRKLLGYARKGRYRIKPLDLNQLIRETSQAFGRTRKKIIIHMDLSAELFPVEVDQGQVEQALLNMYVNASDAMPKGGNLRLSTRNATEKDMKSDVYNPKAGDYVMLAIADTGAGMDKETCERIFEPFFTTKDMARGAGLGLASVYGIVKSHDGYIDVESEIGGGTVLKIYLPRTSKQPQARCPVAERADRPVKTVLVADDEELVRTVAKDLLEAMGYRVLTANDGEETIDLFKKRGHEIDVILLDMMMPRMGGSETFDRLKGMDPDVRVLLSSGYSLEGEAAEIMKRGCSGFIQKPFKLAELSNRLDTVMAGNAVPERE